jgi:hypothetical protein
VEIAAAALCPRRRPDPDRPLDGLVMFTGMSTLDGLTKSTSNPAIVASPDCLLGERSRGTYIVNLQFVDTMRQWSPAVISNISTSSSPKRRGLRAAGLSPIPTLRFAGAVETTHRTDVCPCA